MVDAEIFRSPKFRNYRPEFVPDHKRRHTAYVIRHSTIDRDIYRLKVCKSLHRAAFIAAAHETNSLVLDLMQVDDAIPVPPEHVRWCGILNDDETISGGGSKGPDAFHAASLKELIERAGFITVNTVGPDPMIYAATLRPLIERKLNVLVIETTPVHGEAWVRYASMGRQDAPVSIVREKEDRAEFSRMLQRPTNEGTDSIQ